MICLVRDYPERVQSGQESREHHSATQGRDDKSGGYVDLLPQQQQVHRL